MQGQKRSRLAPYLGVILFTELIVLCWLLRVNTGAREVLLHAFGRHRTEPQGFWKAMTANDPRLGSKMPMPNLVSNSKPSYQASFKRTVLLFLGACQGCGSNGLQDLTVWKRLASELKDANVVAVFYDQPQSLQPLVKGSAPLELALDPGFSVARKYNVMFTPRAYVLDGAHRLVWRQKEPLRADKLAAELKKALERR